MEPAIRIIENSWIGLSDGRRLAARIWLPATDEPTPAILEYLPYRKRDGTAPRDETTHPVFASNGYACVRVDIAGTGESDGIFDDEYSERELSDGEEVISWIASQEWCDGNVGMIGISWGGFNGLQLAFRRPAALKAIVTVCSTADRYADDIHFMGGCLLTDNFNWGAQMHAYQSRPPDPLLRTDWRERWIERMENLPFLAARWLEHAQRDDYWRHGSVCEDWGAIEAATLAVGGWADAYVNTPSALAANLTAPVKALMGPWEHKYPHIAAVNPADFHGEVLGWFDRWLKQIENGADTMPDYRAFMQHGDEPSADYKEKSGRWIAEAEWPSSNVSETEFRLDKGRLSQDGSGKGMLEIASPQQVGLNAAYFCPGMRMGNELAVDQAEDDALSVCFDSLPLKRNMEVLGRPVIEFEFSADQPAAQLVFRLCEVSPDGVSRRVTYRPLNLAHHENHEKAIVLVPGKKYRAVVRLNECAHQFAAGNLVRLAVSTTYWPVIWPAAKAARVSIDLGSASLSLPERRNTDDHIAYAPGEPRAFARLQAEVLRKPKSRTRRRVEEDGTHILETLDDFGRSRDPGHGLETGSRVTQRFSIHPDDPLSARHQAHWVYEFSRETWNVTIDSLNQMTATETEFLLERVISAREGEVSVFHESRARRINR